MSRALLLAFLAALLLFPAAADAGASGVVVSQIYGGGGNAGATLRNDYVELFNGGSGTVDLSSCTVQYATTAGTTWQTTALSGTIAPGRYYLVQLASNADVRGRKGAADVRVRDRYEQSRRHEREDRAGSWCSSADVRRFGRKLLGGPARRGSRRLRQRKRLRR